MTLLVGSIFHVTRKIVSEMTYNVSMGTLNPTIPYHTGVFDFINEIIFKDVNCLVFCHSLTCFIKCIEITISLLYFTGCTFVLDNSLVAAVLMFVHQRKPSIGCKI